MSHYPLFADLKNRPVLLAGAGKVAERKAESLLSAGARVRVVAETLNPQFQQWVTEGKIVWLGGLFEEAMLDEVYFVIAATDNGLFNRRVFEAAERRAKLCNTVDTVDLCSFIVPAVVDRGPLKIAISSGGTAPVLARKWRQIIETLIPLHTGTMARIAGKWREKVKQALNNVEQRRYFWEKLFDGRFGIFAAQNNIEAAERELITQLNRETPFGGEVVLVGAGPGDPGLLTIHALQAIQAADTVFYDALVSDEILAMVRKDAVKISVGKRAGAHRLLVEHAQKGERVVRLKGGDPFVFGRGGEEVQTLHQAGIAYRIVPGITAALGATAYAGIPLTHRDCAQSALFVTGHSKHEGSQPDWQTLALSRQTLVIYMGTLKAAEIAGKLMAYGRQPSTPVAVISNGTLPNQTVRTGRLKDLGLLAAEAERPALMVIGEVVALRDEMKWFGEFVECYEEAA